MEEYKGFGNLNGIADEDFKAEGESSAPTTDYSGAEDNDKKSFDSDELVNEAAEVDEIGVKTDCYHEEGKVTKEIVEMGEGKVKPMMGWLCKIKYIAYFYDKTIFDTSPQDGEEAVEICLGDIAWSEGLWRGIQNMRKNEKSKIRIQKKYAFGRPGEIDKMRFPPGFSLDEADAARRAKITSKAVIYEVTLVDCTERMDMEANMMLYK